MNDHGFNTAQISFIKQLITNRNKEVRHEVSDHLDNTLPLKKLVKGVSGDALVTGLYGPEWETPKNGQLIQRVTQTVNDTRAGAGVFGFNTALQLSLTGDGVNYIKVTMTGFAPYQSAGGIANFNLGIYDNTGAAFIAKQQFYAAVGNSASGYCIVGYVPPFTGTKTYQAAWDIPVGTYVNQAGATYPTMLFAEWAGSTGHS